MSYRKVVIFHGLIDFDPNRSYPEEFTKLGFPKGNLAAAWDELKKSSFIGRLKKYGIQIQQMPDQKLGKNKVEIMSADGKIIVKKADIPQHEAVFDMLQTVLNFFGIESRESPTKTPLKPNEQLVKYALDLRQSKIKKDFAKSKMEPILQQGAPVTTFDWRDDIVRLLLDSKYTEEYHDVIEMVLSYVPDFSETFYLHLACQKKCSVRLLTSLIAKGCDINQRDYEGRTPLHYCAWVKVGRLVQHLLSLKCEIDVQDEDGNTPAHLALLSPHKGDDVFTILKKSGANLELQNKAGQTVVSLAK